MARGKLDIDTYNRKRDFSKTKEPKGRKLKGKGDSFVVQKHDASRLHWDFRLELDGVLKSWAVPKGPSLDPDDKRLAVRTEDHPLDYGEFEGIIPKGEYGGGTVMLWDKGRWQPEPGKDPRKTIEEGHLHFTLDGERMKGEWVMFRLKARPGERQEPWMLKKVDDRFAKPEEGEALVEQCVTSVTTDRSMAEIAAGADVWHSTGKGVKKGKAKRRAGVGPPKFQPPQLATLVDAVPSGNDWLHEYKYDGYRLLLATADGAATAWTRNGNDWSDKFRAIVRAGSKLPAGCLIDGEAVALDNKGKPSFQLLQSSLKGGDRRPCLLCLRPAGRPGRGHPQAAQHRAQGAARRAAQDRQPADHLWRSRHRKGRGAVRSDLQGRRRGDRLEEGQCPISRRAQPKLAQGQMHAAAGIRHRRLAGERQASRLSLIASGGEGWAQAALRRQGRNRVRCSDDSGSEQADEGDRSRRAACRSAASRASRVALDQAGPGRRSRLHGIHP